MSEKKIKTTSPADVYRVIKSILDAEENGNFQEHFYVLGLNNANVIQYIDLISLGTANETVVHPRDIFRNAITKNIVSIIIAHNHPSGENLPSMNDKSMTKRTVQAGEILGIPVLDHVIVGETYYSFKENSLL